MAEGIVSPRGQVVIPAEIRRKYGIQPGTRVTFAERDGEVFFRPLTKEAVQAACGMLHSRSPATKALLHERRKDCAREDRKNREGRPR